MREIMKRIRNGELSEEELSSLYPRKSKYGFYGGSILMGPIRTKEEDLSSIIKELNDNQEENMICKMDKDGKCVGLKPFMDKIMKMKDRMKVMHKKLLQKILKVLKEARSYKKAL